MHRLAAVAVALGFALAPLLAEAPVAAAATPSVTLVTTSTYDVLPAEHRVAVTVAITATSHLSDTITRHYYSDRAYLAVIPSASNFHLTAATGSPSVGVSSRSAAGTVLVLRFGSTLGAGRSLGMTLTFDIADPGGTPDRALRISPSLVSFQAWAYGTDGIPGSSVRVRLPKDYAVVVGRGPLTGPTGAADEHVTFDSGVLPTPATFVADILADRPGTLVDNVREVEVGGQSVLLRLRSWPDDPAWRKQVADLLSPALPALATDIGLPWRLGDELEVRETLPKRADGGSGGGGTGGGTGGTGGSVGNPGDAAALDPAASRLDVAYIANPTSILHGAAHAWFNGDLVTDQWIADGFAALYAERAALVMKVEIASPAMTADALAKAVPLNAWVPGGPSDAYAQAAALALARSIAGTVGDEALRAVWADVARGVPAYRPAATTTGGPTGSVGAAGSGAAAGAPDAIAGPADWRTLLDLLEAHSGTSMDGLWRRWVVRPADAALLDARAVSRQRYEAVLAAAGDWSLPGSIDQAMRAWQFEAANRELDAAASVLRQRDQIAAAARAAGLVPPSSLQAAFQGGDSLSGAAAEAVTELAVITTFVEAASKRPASPDIPTRIGLLGTDPDTDLAAAATSFANGNLDDTLRFAAAARATWVATPDVARGRIISGALLAVTVVLIAWAFVQARRKRAARASRGSPTRPVG